MLSAEWGGCMPDLVKAGSVPTMAPIFDKASVRIVRLWEKAHAGFELTPKWRRTLAKTIQPILAGVFELGREYERKRMSAEARE